MTASLLPGELYVVGTKHNVGTWDGVGVDNLGNLGGLTILQLTFDSDGAMWCVGTGNNVGKWNGQGWVDMGRMGGWTIQQIVFDRDGTLWCVSTDHSVGKWNGHKFDDQGYMGGWHIQQILFDANGVMWCVGTEHNVGKWNGHGWDNQGHMGGWQIQQILFDAEGVMWCVGTEYNVGKWNGSAGRIYDRHSDGMSCGLPGDRRRLPRPSTTGPFPFPTPAWQSSLAYGMVWRSAGGTLYGFDHFTGKQTYAISQFGADRSVRAAEPYDDGLLVYASDGYLYKATSPPQPSQTKVAWQSASSPSGRRPIAALSIWRRTRAACSVSLRQARISRPLRMAGSRSLTAQALS